MAAFLTLSCAGAIATWISFNGFWIDWPLWSFTFTLAVVGIVWVCGLGAVVGSTPLTDMLTIYRWLTMFMLIVVSLPVIWLAYAPPRKPAPAHRSLDIVPAWWPIQDDGWRVTTRQ